MKSISGSNLIHFLSIALPCSAAAIPANVNILRPSQGIKRATTALTSLVPQTNVSLHYASVNATIDADVAAEMKLPSVLLETIAAISQVDCSSDSVNISFTDAAAFAGLSTWPSSDFLLFTNSLGDCDVENERGVYLVKSLELSNSTLSVMASTRKTSLAEQAKGINITFTSTTTPAKRDLSATVSADISGQTLYSDNGLTIMTEDSSISSTVTLTGGLAYNFLELKLEELYLDIDLAADLDLGVTASVTESYSTNLYSYNPGSLSVAAFSIPGVLDLGPYLQFEVGIEFAAAGTVEASVGFTSSLSDGKIHLDFVNSSLTTTSGWTPTYNVSTEVGALVELQLNPYVDLTLGLGISLFSGLLDLSAGIEAKPMVLNVFAVEAEFDYTSESGVVFAAPTNETCVNGAWFASTFIFEVDAFVTSFYNVQLYEVELPIYESECWTWIE